ncbi:hypothetical protein KUTeg_002674 [Tegillarca granosa]|uniref:RNase H type-1 domain-containing protein n=1 Tax=Tegillarca granosa TaxID=220873 RepID=A0ABQ9FYJ6_TEGGR|nr:hypothetical protein KUTeg_002674 [Tegillarca granosa]
MATDSSGYKWGALVFDKAKTSFGDVWDSADHRPIHLKKTDALINALTSLKGKIENYRVDAYVDNKPLIDSWNNGGGRDTQLNDLLKKLLEITQLYNLDLKLHFLPSEHNPADGESRKLSAQDSQLSSEKWSILEHRYGPHSVDLMALDSNSIKDRCGNKLRHFTLYPSPLSSGVNMFSQDLYGEVNPYVFPPFHLISSVLKYFESQKIDRCTMIVPDMQPTPVWWPKLRSNMESYFVIGEIGEVDVIRKPSKTF